jgi:predicted Zn-dependent protease with MMP-like domain
MNPLHRQLFDQQLELVLAELPDRLHELMLEIPLVVEDFPSAQVLRKARVRRRSGLLGLYIGIPITEQSVNQWGVLSPVVHIYRLGILRQVQRRGEIDPAELREQIRITILHEYGHHHGLTERDLRELGYG